MRATSPCSPSSRSSARTATTWPSPPPTSWSGCKLNMLKPLDRARLTNLKHTDPKLPEQAPTTRTTSTACPTCGVFRHRRQREIHQALLGEELDDLWSPAYKGKLLLMDDMRDVFAMSLRSSVFGQRHEPGAHQGRLPEAPQAQAGVKVFNSDFKQPFLNNEVTIGQDLGRRDLPGGPGEPQPGAYLPQGRRHLLGRQHGDSSSAREHRERPRLHQLHAQRC